MSASLYSLFQKIIGTLKDLKKYYLQELKYLLPVQVPSETCDMTDMVTNYLWNILHAFWVWVHLQLSLVFLLKDLDVKNILQIYIIWCRLIQNTETRLLLDEMQIRHLCPWTLALWAWWLFLRPLPNLVSFKEALQSFLFPTPNILIPYSIATLKNNVYTQWGGLFWPQR